ncbi:MAG TPA: DUF1566 domain-containing protein [Candidatus Binatia bacterium]|jgi:hypothetical protein
MRPSLWLHCRRFAVCALVLGHAVFAAGPALAGRHSQPLATGQTDCFDDLGLAIDCAGSGQDGEFQAGAKRQLVDNGDGTISDLATGLMWEKLSADGSVHQFDNQYKLQSTKIPELNATRFAGYTDWRVPNVRELETLQDFDRRGHATPTEFDHDCVPGCTILTCSCLWRPAFYHSSSIYAESAFFAWDVGFRLGWIHPIEKYSGQPIRAVRTIVGAHPRSRTLRTGQTRCYSLEPFERQEVPCAGTGEDAETRTGLRRSFTDNADGTITDDVTGLTWEKLSSDGSIHDGNTATYYWDDSALKMAQLNAERFAGHDDWRLPNIRELMTLRTISRVGPAAYPAFNNHCEPGCSTQTCSCSGTGGAFWSSTTLPYKRTEAWTLDVYAGAQLPLSKPLAHARVRAVRGGL